MVSEKVEMSDINEKKSEAKIIDAGGKVEKNNLNSTMQKMGKTHGSQNHVLVRRKWKIFLIDLVFHRGFVQEEIPSS